MLNAPNSRLLSALRKAVRSAVSDALDGEAHCALTVFPDQWNAGDSLIWLGAIQTLQTLGVHIRYTCCHRTYRKCDLQKRHPDGPILLHGGGNLGDVYMNEEGLRRQILIDFPDRKIIQLPQSIWYRDPEIARQAGEFYSQYANFQLMLRDRASMDWARQHWSLTPELVPDLALGVTRLPRVKGPVTAPVMGLLRVDKEQHRDRLDTTWPAAYPRTDWIHSDNAYNRFTPYEERCAAAYENGVKKVNTKRLNLFFSRSRYQRVQNRLATVRVQRGLRILNLGEQVITDRLHAHLMCLLTGKPNILMDNAYGKNAAVYHTWSSKAEGCLFADSLDEALDWTIARLS